MQGNNMETKQDHSPAFKPTNLQMQFTKQGTDFYLLKKQQQNKKRKLVKKMKCKHGKFTSIKTQMSWSPVFNTTISINFLHRNSDVLKTCFYTAISDLLKQDVHNFTSTSKPLKYLTAISQQEIMNFLLRVFLSIYTNATKMISFILVFFQGHL